MAVARSTGGNYAADVFRPSAGAAGCGYWRRAAGLFAFHLPHNSRRQKQAQQAGLNSQCMHCNEGRRILCRHRC